MIDLFEMLIEGAASWSVGKILDMLIQCDWCGQRDRARIGNVQFNDLSCRNCHREVSQFTNACDFTVDPNGRVGHVGARLLGGYSVDVNPYEKAKYEGWLYFYMAMRSREMLGRQFVVTGKIADYNTGTIYTACDTIYESIYADCCWYDNCVTMKWQDIPEAARDQRIFAIDLEVKSEFGDLLCVHRRLEKLWK